MENNLEDHGQSHRASTKSCAECAGLWRAYFEVDRKFLRIAREHLPLLSGGFDPRREAEYQQAGELRQAARRAIDAHRSLAHAHAAMISGSERLALRAQGAAL
jgi:hypothetical protein